MKDKPIIMSAPMLRCLMEGKKTQTRRIMKPWFGKKHPTLNLKEHGDSNINYSGRFDDPGSWGYPYAEDGAADIAIGDSYWANMFCPYGSVGDLIWVRENFCKNEMGGDPAVFYAADGYKKFPSLRKLKWKPSIHMPRHSSRLTLEITAVRVERLQGISTQDAAAEGLRMCSNGYWWHSEPESQFWAAMNPIQAYEFLWGDIHGYESWQANPWVWVLDFKVHKQNIDEFLKTRAA